jgi:hypothetical protein
LLSFMRGSFHAQSERPTLCSESRSKRS